MLVFIIGLFYRRSRRKSLAAMKAVSAAGLKSEAHT